ncbi:SPOR domain-containing protein [Sphingomonas sp. GB1N7]|uniref:SPOR domain-containing protein n=1 Tax=Parasphingomonas caseinilytica TaxID=3096158 RepID=UPI002FC9BDEA
MRKRVSLLAIGLTALIAATSGAALADVKHGIDLWNQGEYRKAADEWRPAAIAGDAQAQFNLGQAYKLGRGVPTDMPMAESWYRKAALQGLPQAEVNYGLALFDRGDRAGALPWLEKSVARGEPRAQLVLGTMLFNGDGVSRDYPRAYALMVRSSAANVPSASKVLAQMDQYVPLADRQQGMILARQYEADAQRVDLPPPEIAGQGNDNAMRATELPASSYEVSNHQPAPRTAPPRQTVAATRVVPAPAAPSGNWRVQLGAFGDPANARKLWTQMGGKFAGRTPYYVKSGTLTRLLVGPYATNAEAARACAAIKPCVPTGG